MARASAGRTVAVNQCRFRLSNGRSAPTRHIVHFLEVLGTQLLMQGKTTAQVSLQDSVSSPNAPPIVGRSKGTGTGVSRAGLAAIAAYTRQAFPRRGGQSIKDDVD